MTVKVSRILHAGYVFESDGTTIAFDPIVENPFSRNCHAFPDVRFDPAQVAQLRLDAVFISHYHDDHCSLDSLDCLDKRTPIYLYCLFEEMFDMIRALGFDKVQQVRTNEAVRVGGFEVIPREALDKEVDSLFQIKAEGMNILNVVDAWIDSEVLARYASDTRWDLVLWPFQTMRELDVLWPSRATPAPATLPEEWIEQLAMLNPRFVVPSSCQFVQERWSWYNHAFFPVTYRQFEQEVGAALPHTQVVRMNPSASFELDTEGMRSTSPLHWVIPVGEQDVDYAYDPTLPVPTTASIAQHFLALDAQQQAVVSDYCRHGLAERLGAMETDGDSFFAQPRVWRLTVYDHAGQPTHFHYRLEGKVLATLPDGATPEWTTEVPAAKLYGALVLGESLTTMYMRINDAPFSDAIRRQQDDAEVIDDPLIRALFNDVFGAYQAAQLRRLRPAPAPATMPASTD